VIFLFSLLEERVVGLGTSHFFEGFPHPLGVGTRRFDGALGSAQFRRGHHLHGAGDFLSRPNTRDPSLDIA
jgi:hypothetical protein